MKPSERGTIIIVARQNCHLTKATVRTALVQDYAPGCDVFVINNASTDSTSDYLRSQPGIVTATFPEQKSLAACWNYGLEIAFKTTKNPLGSFGRRGGGHVLVLNNDVEIRTDTYRTLAWYDSMFVTAVSVDTPERMNVERDLLTSDWAPRPHPDFSCFMIRRECWEKVGKFNEAYYPAYCEDCDYHVRMHRAGITALCIDLPFLHHGAQTLKHASAEDAIKIRKGADANRKRFQAAYGCLPGTPEYEALFL